MNHVPFPLIIPIDDERHIYKGFITIKNIEYQIQLQLGPRGYLHGQENLLELFHDYPQAKDLVETKLHQATDVMPFLNELKEIIETTAIADNNRFNYSHNRYSLIYNEVKKIGFENVEEISDDMLQITLKTVDEHDRKHLVKIDLPSNYPYASPKAEWDLPVAVSNHGTLAHILAQHRAFVIKFQLLFNCMDDLDKHMRIIEPERPKRSDTWRRIALGHHCSLEIHINAESPLDMKPKIRFFGSANRVKDLQSKWKESSWNKDLLMHQNLLDSFQLVSNSTDAYEDYTTTGDIECGICYSYKLNHTDTPDIICSNMSCSRGFHYQCLYEVSYPE
ncbi:E3 ubiquitin-protein ligase FANCL [Mucor ambiguus]|uniref:E3 ubiquitin-protein ligase FANCL n=1 Tax=Mucor ambiguus TaxID=91626 RepID=A0A0C9MC26_9FUNG|nr:E3 ubiquitin-protein ligase FANCL [Mucor ambiguus]